MVEKDLKWPIILRISAHVPLGAVRQHGERDLKRMRIVLFGLGLVVAIMTVGGFAETVTMDLEAGPPTKPETLVSLGTDGPVGSEGSLSGTVLPPKSVLGAGVLAAESTREAVVNRSQAETPHTHIPTAVVLVSCALVALATLGRRRKTNTS